jgi:hypothetical protein
MKIFVQVYIALHMTGRQLQKSWHKCGVETGPVPHVANNAERTCSTAIGTEMNWIGYRSTRPEMLDVEH